MTRRLLVLFLVALNCTAYAQSSTPPPKQSKPPATAKAVPSPPAMTNADVIELVGAGFSDELVIGQIQKAAAKAFDLSTKGLVALKTAKVSERVIAVMLGEPDPGIATVAPAAVTPPPATAIPTVTVANSLVPPEVGVYVKSDGKLLELHPEVITWRTGGFLKSVATLGINNGHVNGVVKGSRSSQVVSLPVEFIIRCQEGTSVSEYQLLRLDQKDNRREFRAITGGVVHATGGADRNAVAFQFEKIAPSTFSVTLKGLADGEYGFLPPGFSSSSAASAGKLYTFDVR